MEERKKKKRKKNCSIKFKERQKRFHIIIVKDAGAAAAEKKVFLNAELGSLCSIQLMSMLLALQQLNMKKKMKKRFYRVLNSDLWCESLE